MAKQRKPRQADPNVVAKSMIDQIIAKTEGKKLLTPPVPKPKNTAAQALAKLGAKKGGNTRAQKLSPARRKEIAQQAAAARWGKP